MQNIIEICKEYGLEVPADKQSEFTKKVAENYLTKAEHEKKIGKLETDRDTWKEKAETAENTLKGFEGVDLDTMKNELNEWKKRAGEAEETYKKQIAERDLNDKLKEAISGVKMHDDMADIITAELKELVSLNKNGDLIGFEQGIKSLKEKRPTAFIDEAQQQNEANRARFTQPAKPGSGAKTGRQKLAAMTLDERMKLKASDPDYYESLRKGD